MKYNININQYAICAELKLDIDLFDAVILDYIYWICASVHPNIKKSRVVIDDNLYTWINYEHLISENPILKLKAKGAISKRLENLEKNNLIGTKISSGYYKRKYVMITPTTEMIYSNTRIPRDITDLKSCQWCKRSDLPLNKHHIKKGSDETIEICIDCHHKHHLKTPPVHTDEHDVHPNEQTPIHGNEHIIILDNNNTKDKKVSFSKKAKLLNSPYEESFETFWNLYPEKVGKGKAYEVWQLLEKPIKQKCIDAITEQVEKNHFYKDWLKKNSVPHPTTWLNQRRWEDVVKDNNKSDVSRDPKYNNLKVHTA